MRLLRLCEFISQGGELSSSHPLVAATSWKNCDQLIETLVNCPTLRESLAAYLIDLQRYNDLAYYRSNMPVDRYAALREDMDNLAYELGDLSASCSKKYNEFEILRRLYAFDVEDLNLKSQSLI